MKFVPHSYQRYAIDFIKSHEEAAVLLDMGLGKTVITLTAVSDLLFDSFLVKVKSTYESVKGILHFCQYACFNF